MDEGNGLNDVDSQWEKVLSPEVAKLKEQIGRAQFQVETNPSAGVDVTIILLDSARYCLSLFDSYSGKEGPTKSELSDEVAAAANLLLLTFQKKTNDDVACIHMLKGVLPFATSQDTRERIEKNIQVLSVNRLAYQTDVVRGIFIAIEASPLDPKTLLGRFQTVAQPRLTELRALIAEDTYLELSDSAAKVLRGISLNAWKKYVDLPTALEANELARKHALEASLVKSLLEDQTALGKNQVFLGLEKVDSPPTLTSYNGSGFTLYGSSDYDEGTQTYVTTHYFIFSGIPIFPVGRYRVMRTDGKVYRFFGKVPLRRFDVWHQRIVLGLVGLLIIYSILTF